MTEGSSGLAKLEGGLECLMQEEIPSTGEAYSWVKLWRDERGLYNRVSANLGLTEPPRVINMMIR